MIYAMLIIIPLCNSVMQILRKEYNEKTTHISSPISVFLTLTFIISIIFYGTNDRWNISINMPTFIYSAILALLVIFSNVVTIIALNHTDVIKFSVFTGAGCIVIPFLYGIIFSGDHVSALKTVSALLLIFVIILPVFEKGGRHISGPKEYILLMLSFIQAGIVVVFYKIYGQDTRVLSDNMLCMWTNILIIPFVAAFAMKTVGIKQLGRDFKKTGLVPILIALGIILIAAVVSLWEIAALKQINITVYTIFKNSLGLIFTAVLSAIFFKEKITPAVALSIALSIAAIVLYSI